ncbi:hypothetical protein SAMN05444157_1589 [Frankineae bacterium MT45]|nr:hypothetical protein SAMN05444157_1589 [Frankineae bacterium MT45]
MTARSKFDVMIREIVHADLVALHEPGDLRITTFRRLGDVYARAIVDDQMQIQTSPWALTYQSGYRLVRAVERRHVERRLGRLAAERLATTEAGS